MLMICEICKDPCAAPIQAVGDTAEHWSCDKQECKDLINKNSIIDWAIAIGKVSPRLVELGLGKRKNV